MLLNETYTGRTIFRRTRAERYRDGRTGKTKRRVSQREETEWIDVEGATPATVSREQYAKVVAILHDPTRRNRSRPSPLCNRQESACTSRYIRTGALEAAVRDALTDLLCNPRRILAEAKRLAQPESASSELELILNGLKDVEARQRRLVRLFTEGDIPQELLEEQRRELSQRRAHLEAERVRLEALAVPSFDLETIERSLPDLTRRIRTWLSEAEGERLNLLLRAVDAQISASSDIVRIKGSVPLCDQVFASDLATTERTSA